MNDRNIFVNDIETAILKLKRKTGQSEDIDRTVSNLRQIIFSRRQTQTGLDKLKEERNVSSANFKNLSAEEKIDFKKRSAILKEDIQEQEEALSRLIDLEQSILLKIPNIPCDSAPDGTGDSDNVLVRSWGDQFAVKKKFTHDEIGQSSGEILAEEGTKISGSRFLVTKGNVSKLDRVLVNFFMDWHTENGYEEVSVPYIVNKSSMIGTGQLPKFEEDLFKLEGKVGGEEAYLIPTAEVPVTNIYRDVCLTEDQLPIRNVCFSPCFRSEAGAAGRDVKGLIRLHQFHKVELVSICNPESSLLELEKITKDAEELLKALKLPYRVIERCCSDLGFGGYKGYDIEVWMAGQGTYREISSATLFWDFQARRANIKYKNQKGKNEFVHTLNASGLAIGRTVAAIMEFYQNDKNGFDIPAVLIPRWH